MKKAWNFIKKKKWWFAIGVIILIVVLLAGGKKDNEYLYDTVGYGDVSETILATGQVISSTDLELSFPQSGIVNSIPVEVGDVVYKGQILASLQNSSERASLTQAEAALARAEASYQQVIGGAADEDIEVARVALQNAKTALAQSKIQQDSLVENARRTLLSGSLEAVSDTPTGLTAPAITGVYTGGQEGEYRINIYSSGDGTRFNINGLEIGSGFTDTTRSVPLGSKGLFVQFPATESLVGTTWVVEIPNKRSASYSTNLSAYQAAVESRAVTVSAKESAVDTAQANLNQLVAAATNSELLLAQADILSAEGQVSAALARLEDKRIRAPEAGTITRIDANLGELIQAYRSALILQNTEELLLEANINEANITKVNVGMPVEVTFDAFSFDEVLMAEVVNIDIASTLVSGVVNYRIKARLVEDFPNLRPGMTANMTLVVGKKENVLSVPGRAIIEKEDGSKAIMVKDGDDTLEKIVEVGFEGDGTIVEILSGLEEGQEVVINP